MSKTKDHGKELWMVAAIALLALVYFFFGQAEPYEPGSPAGSPAGSPVGGLEIRADEINDYFVYVSAEEANRMLAEARENGEFKFLFPQIDFGSFESIVIQEREMTNSRGERVALLGIGGLENDATLYSNIEGTMRASVLTYESAEATDLIIFTGESSNLTSEFYVPYISGENDISRELQGIIDVRLGTPIVDIVGSAYLNQDVFTENWQLALIVKDTGSGNDGDPDKGSLSNVLRKSGKIVMVEI